MTDDECKAEIVRAELAPSAGRDLMVIAVQNGAGADELERIAAMIERREKWDAERAYAEARTACKSDLPIVVRDATNTHTHSRFARLENISRAIDPVIARHGFTLSFGCKPSAKENSITVTCRCRHTGGHYEDFELPDLPDDSQGLKGTANKTPIQGRVSTTSYGKRVLKSMIFDVAIADSDIDGNESIDPITDEQVMDLSELMERKVFNRMKFYAYFGIGQAKELPSNRLEEAMTMLSQKPEKSS